MTLRVEALGVTFAEPARPALDGLSFEVARGEVLGLTGGSGAGKSLIAEALAGCLPAGAGRSGRITLNGGDAARQAIALAPQRIDALDPLARVGRQLARFGGLGGRKVDIPGSLAAVGLDPAVARLYPHALSGGMARRVLLATALATGAGWIVADEPTVGLDKAAADRIMALLRGLAARGHGLVVISHDLPRLAGIADRVVVLREGQPVETAPGVAFEGEGRALRSPFSRALWQAQPRAAAPC